MKHTSKPMGSRLRGAGIQLLDLTVPLAIVMALMALFLITSPTRALWSEDEAPERAEEPAPLAEIAERLYGSIAELERAAKQLREVESSGGWPKVSDGPVLVKGDTGERVDQVRRRLLASDATSFSAQEAEGSYDDELVAAVEAFQRRHGLLVDGKVGPETLAAMNVTAGERAAQLDLNRERREQYLERRGDEPGPAAVLVNLPEARLHALSEGGSDVLSMKVIVGEAAWSTPELRETLESIVINPYWYIPIEILAAELKEKIVDDLSYLSENRMEVVDDVGPNAKAIDPEDVDWRAVDAEDPNSFPYYLRQKPGPENPLGRIKFLMPNTDDIYLHDTPAEQLFERDKRALSHGCIRLERPLDFARLVVDSATEDWDLEQVKQAIDSSEHEVVPLDPHLPVDLVYWTAWVGSDGRPHFAPDVYDRDQTKASESSPSA